MKKSVYLPIIGFFIGVVIYYILNVIAMYHKVGYFDIVESILDLPWMGFLVAAIIVTLYIIVVKRKSLRVF